MTKGLALLLAAMMIAPHGGVAFAANSVVAQKGKQFNPRVLNIKVGDTVTFRNNDKHRHNVYSRTSGHKFRIKKQKPGQSDQVTFDKPGKIEVRCAMHPKMKLVINVTK